MNNGREDEDWTVGKSNLVSAAYIGLRTRRYIWPLLAGVPRAWTKRRNAAEGHAELHAWMIERAKLVVSGCRGVRRSSEGLDAALPMRISCSTI
jgi:hypothetical protein